MPLSDEAPKAKAPSREEALAQALRANLKRRKAGARPTSQKTGDAKSVDEH